MTQTEEQKRSEEQARAQLASIVEMVAKLTREGAAKVYLSEKSLPELRIMVEEHEITINADSGASDWTEDREAQEMREALESAISEGAIEPDDFEFDEEAAQQAIHEDALSVEVRTGWHSPGDSEGRKPSEFRILLCTGGPACQIIGDLSEHGEPERPRLQHQDWGTPWTELVDISSDEREALLTYCQQFYFGE